VTVAAINPEATDMVFMAEWDGLISRDILLGDVGRTGEGVTEPDGKNRKRSGGR
jgi:hypothetical protein